MKLWKMLRARRLNQIIEPTVIMLISGARVALARSDELVNESYEYRHAVAYGLLKKEHPTIDEPRIELALALARSFPEL
jgi:hypothetical protein